MSSKVISPSFHLVVVDGSVTISVGSILAETGTFPRLGSEVLNFRWMLYTKSWFARGSDSRHVYDRSLVGHTYCLK